MEAPREGQVGPKMGPSWGKIGSGSELDGIIGHLRRNMAVKFDVRRKMFKNQRKNYVFRAQEVNNSTWAFCKHSGDGGR